MTEQEFKDLVACRRDEKLAVAVVTAARMVLASARGTTEPVVDGYALDRLAFAVEALDAAKGGQ